MRTGNKRFYKTLVLAYLHRYFKILNLIFRKNDKVFTIS